MLLDSIPGVEKVADKNHTLYTLWGKYGEWKSEGPRLFNTEHLVQRQDGHLRASAAVDVPEICTVLRLSRQDQKEYGVHVSDILIRNEYLKSLCDICHFATRRVFPPQNDTAEGPITFHNPFLDMEAESRGCAVSVLGHPGIGKSLWVVVVLVLRILAGRPTIYHSTAKLIYVFNQDGLYNIDPTDHNFLVAKRYFLEAISPNYWCLVDCNNTLRMVPEILSATDAFIVQAASPRSERLDWVKKYHLLASRYFMENWSLPELIVGRALQLNDLNEQCSEQGLEIFYSRYAPSPRMAYIYADDLESYEQIVHTDVTQLTFETLGKILSAAEALQVEHVSHHILLVSPQRDRSYQSITIPSRYMYDKLRDQLHIHTLEEAARLYQNFVRNQYTKGSAGYMLDDIHDLFCNGGQWPLSQMTKNKPGPVNTHFKSQTSMKADLYMRIGYGDEQVAFKRRLTQGAIFTRLVHHRFLRGQNIHLEDGYYQPAADQPTFDGFIYEQRTRTAIVLQMAVGAHHDVKVDGLEWLIGQGARKIHLVVVKPPNTPLDLAVPNNLTSSINELVVESLESVQ